ncbi:MAG: hypothetical protein J6J23_04055, partial [Clostridia bacterium]|nr:hypothetical protein [Clostridia bacterium]
ITAAAMLNSENAKDVNVSYASGLTGIDKYFDNYFTGFWSKGVNYDEEVTSLNFIQSVSKERTNWAQNVGSPYSLRVESYISLRNEVVSDINGLKFKEGEKLTNHITINNNDANTATKTDDGTYTVSKLGGKGHILIRTLGMIFEDKIIGDKETDEKLARTMIISSIVFVALMVITVVLTIVSLGSAAPTLTLPASGMIATIKAINKFVRSLIVFLTKTIISHITKMLIFIILESAIVGIIAFHITSSILSSTINESITAGAPLLTKMIRVRSMTELDFYSD